MGPKAQKILIDKQYAYVEYNVGDFKLSTETILVGTLI